MGKISKLLLVVFMSSIVATACGPKPYYKTREGKKKQKYYNSIQYDREFKPRKKRN